MKPTWSMRFEGRDVVEMMPVEVTGEMLFRRNEEETR
jgi:hypothetical protein